MKKIMRINGVFYKLKRTNKEMNCEKCEKQNNNPCDFDLAINIIKHQMKVSNICNIKIKDINHSIDSVKDNFVTYINKDGHMRTKEFTIIDY